MPIGVSPLVKTVVSRVKGDIGGRLFVYKDFGYRGWRILSQKQIDSALKHGINRPISEEAGNEFYVSSMLPIIPIEENTNEATINSIFDTSSQAPINFLRFPESILASAVRDGFKLKVEASMEPLKVVAIADWLLRETEGKFIPYISITLGSGLGGLADEINTFRSFDYRNIPFLPTNYQTLDGHNRTLVLGTLGDKNVAGEAGRLHLYEGYHPYETVRLKRALKVMGAEIAMITNAVGAISDNYQIGDIVTHQGAKNESGESVLRGPNFGCGDRFLAILMNDPELQKIAEEQAPGASLTLHNDGFFVQVMGPEYENIGLIKFYKNIDNTDIGMSGFHELIAAIHAKYRCFWYSFISNKAAGLNPDKLAPSHDEVTAACKAAEPKLIDFATKVIKRIKKCP